MTNSSASQTGRDLRRSHALRSQVTADGTVEVSLDEIDVPEPGPDQVVVRIEAASINPSDVGMLFAYGHLADATASVVDGRPVLTAPLSPAGAAGAAARVGQSLPVGNEAAGTVVAAGKSTGAQELIGKVVGLSGGGMYTELRCIDASECLPFPEGTSAADAAAWFINPVTTQLMLATMREEGHSSLVHTTAASSLGRILVRLCRADDVPLVNIVRRPEQVAELRAIGAEHVCDSSSDGFDRELEDAIAATGASLAFDALGGGVLGDRILSAMERAHSRGRPFHPYGSPIRKRLYVYGGLDRGPTELRRAYGTEWDIGGWMVMRRLERTAPEAISQMKARIAAEMRTTFATSFAASIRLAQALDPDTARTYARASTNGKHMINPAA